MEVTPDLTVIVIAAGGEKRLLSFLGALHDTAGMVEFETIVLTSADNGHEFAQSAAEFPDVLFYELSGRPSRGAAVNHALRLARGRYVALCADSLKLLPHCLTGLIDFMDDNPEAGIAAPQIIFPDGEILRSAHPSLSPFSMLMNSIAKKLPGLFPVAGQTKYTAGRHADPVMEAAWLAAHCLVVRSEVFEEIGLLDEKFITTLESADFCRRAQKKGWHLYYVSTARARIRERPQNDMHPEISVSDLLRLAGKKWLNRP